MVVKSTSVLIQALGGHQTEFLKLKHILTRVPWYNYKEKSKNVNMTTVDVSL